MQLDVRDLVVEDAQENEEKKEKKETEKRICLWREEEKRMRSSQQENLTTPFGRVGNTLQSKVIWSEWMMVDILSKVLCSLVSTQSSPTLYIESACLGD